MEKILYHGSQYKDLPILLPSVSFDHTSFVYATSDRKYALVRAGKFDYQIPYIKEEYTGDKCILAELRPNAFMDLFNCEGYIYEVNSKGFTESSNKTPNEFVRPKKTEIAQMTVISNIWSEMQLYPDFFKFVSYADVNNEYWSTVDGGREGYTQRRLHNIELINNLLGKENKNA